MTGDLHFQDQLIIDGSLLGNVYADMNSPSILTASRTAFIKGKIHTPTVYINGKVEGFIRADKMLVLGSKAEVTGDIAYNFIQVEKGAQVNGTMTHISRMTDSKSDPKEKRENKLFQKISQPEKIAETNQKPGNVALPNDPKKPQQAALKEQTAS